MNYDEYYELPEEEIRIVEQRLRLPERKSTDRAIQRLVHELHELTEDEMKVVENN
jgi:hypothetical protein